MMSTFTDQRDGEVYKTVEINNQIWMAENLRYRGPVKKFNGWTIEEKEFYYPPDGKQKNIREYGCLYTWKNALRAVPNGWHLPSKKEFMNLLSYVTKYRKSIDNFLALIAKSTAWSNYKDQGGDDFGFSALSAGYCRDAHYDDFGYYAYFWSSTEDASDGAHNLYLGYGYANVIDYFKDSAFSVRCIKN